VRTGYTSPTSEKYTLPEDIPAGHVALKGSMICNSEDTTIYDYFYDVMDGTFKSWEDKMGAVAIGDDAEVLVFITLGYMRLVCDP
jgi:hypothetical protein